MAEAAGHSWNGSAAMIEQMTTLDVCPQHIPLNVEDTCAF